MKRVGFWRGDGVFYWTLPDPRQLVDASWDALVRASVVAHLKSGRRLDPQFGYSWCRFRCGRPDDLMGSADMTDGVYVWPEGLVHYVEDHCVRLPDDFTAHVMARRTA